MAPSPRYLTWSLALLLSWFGARLLYFAITIGPFVPPDEVTHFGKCVVFSNYLLLPDNSPESYQYGLVTNIPWLYYWIMGKLLPLNLFGMSDLLFLRLLNIPFAFGTVYFTWRTLRLLTDDRLTRLLLVVAMTNTLMFTFLSATVSYDNLTNLLAAMAIYYLASFLVNRSDLHLALSLLSLLAGCLTKITFLPLVPVMAVILIAHEIKGVRTLPASVADFFRAEGKRGIVVGFLALFLLILNVRLYGGNYLRFGHLEAGMSDLFPFEIAMKYRIEARDTIFTLFTEGRISLDEARAMATRYIGHEGDRRGTVFLVENYARRARSGEPLMGPLPYAVAWGERMVGSIFGISGHLAMPNLGFTAWSIAAVMALSIVPLLLRLRPRGEGWAPASLAVIAGFYTIFLLYGVNYRIYREYDYIDVALQGRYIFPVIGTIYLLSCCCLLRLFRGRYARAGVFIATAALFIASDFPFFLRNVTPEWYVWPL